ncbi:tetratricopeptide repeat protein [Pontibacter mucosus]|uniref:Regulator of microtubule dynamics protein 1 n=1 Tax=Pontibacter mucosus TaxID=1649266 RepID=A0A2T5YL30_9BACT|nr:tetratricopeptide repeat protein [Pontibacter mucosus]PTX20040.1 tetratricopeptide repeat protein [Pontibacter mucosus]
MKIVLKAVILCCALGVACSEPVWAEGGASGNNELLKKAEQLLSDYKESEALQIYEQVLAESPDNVEVLCKASVLHSRIGERFLDETHKQEHFLKAKQYALKAYELQPEDAEPNYAMALAIGSKAMASGPKERLQNFHQMKSFVDAALADNSQHAGSWHLLGRWYFKMANLNFAEKTASKVFFGGVCGEATNELAADAIEKAITYDPDNIAYYYDLANIYKEMKNTTSCINTLQRALTLTLATKEELELSRRCSMLLQEQQQKQKL